jgi:hypothetical protein
MVVALAFWKTRLARREVALVVGIGGGLGFWYAICVYMYMYMYFIVDLETLRSRCFYVCLNASC